MQGGKRQGSGRKNKADYLRRDVVTIRLPNWMVLQIKKEGEMGCVIEYQLLKAEFIHQPKEYK